MYSIMIPYKAYAAGDFITTILKFTPTAKGVSVLSIGLELKEIVTLRWKCQPDTNETQIVAHAEYDTKDGRAVRARQDGLVPPLRGDVGSGAAGAMRVSGGTGCETAAIYDSTQQLSTGPISLWGHSAGPSTSDLPKATRSSRPSRSTLLKSLMSLVYG
jgi:hypothetical protein